MHVHANALLTGSGTTSIVLADLREPEAILIHPKVRALMDLTQPTALLLVATWLNSSMRSSSSRACRERWKIGVASSGYPAPR